MLNGALEMAHREKRVNEKRNIKILVAQMHVVKGELEEALRKFQLLVQENQDLCQGIVYSSLNKKNEAICSLRYIKVLYPKSFHREVSLMMLCSLQREKIGNNLRRSSRMNSLTRHEKSCPIITFSTMLS